MSDYIPDPSKKDDPLLPGLMTFGGRRLDVYGPGAHALWIQTSKDDDGATLWSAILLFVLASLYECKTEAEKEGASNEEEVCRRAYYKWLVKYDDRLKARAEVLLWLSKWNETDRKAAALLTNKILTDEKKQRPAAEPEAVATGGIQPPGKSRRPRKRS
jgi:hypothetical protein